MFLIHNFCFFKIFVAYIDYCYILTCVKAYIFKNCSKCKRIAESAAVTICHLRLNFADNISLLFPLLFFPVTFLDFSFFPHMSLFSKPQTFCPSKLKRLMGNARLRLLCCSHQNGSLGLYQRCCVVPPVIQQP